MGSSDGTLLWLQGENAVKSPTVKDTQIVAAIDALLIVLWPSLFPYMTMVFYQQLLQLSAKSIVRMGACSVHPEQARR